MEFNYNRRFGSEIEVNAFDGESHPRIEGSQPNGIQKIAHIVSKTLDCRCEIHNWLDGQRATECNDAWIVKPDGSCGIEICSPVSKGLYGISCGAAVVAALANSPTGSTWNNTVRADSRCSLHIHTEIADLTIEQIATVLAYWVKCEYTMLLAMPDRRKMNRYCQVIGMSDLLRADIVYPPVNLINRLGSYKYYTANSFQYSRNKRPTLEFRIADEEACLNSVYFRNWHKLILHFVEIASQTKYPEDYDVSDPHTGYAWLCPNDVLKFLKFDCDLGPELQETRDWFVGRINQHSHSILGGIWDSKVVDCVWKTQQLDNAKAEPCC